MTPKQRHLARHALGLPNKNWQSYRNRYVESPNHVEWEAMVQRGEALAHPLQKHSTLFYLTRKGAELALEPGEKLCPEDFP